MDSLSTGVEPKKSSAEVAFFPLGLTDIHVHFPGYWQGEFDQKTRF